MVLQFIMFTCIINVLARLGIQCFLILAKVLLIKSCSAMGSFYETESKIWASLGRSGSLEFAEFLYITFHNCFEQHIYTLCCKCLGSLPMFWRAGMGEGGKPLPIAFQYLIFMVQRPCDLNLVMISSLASKCQDFKVKMPFFQPLYVMKLKTSKFKVLAFCCQ